MTKAAKCTLAFMLILLTAVLAASAAYADEAMIDGLAQLPRLATDLSDLSPIEGYVPLLVGGEALPLDRATGVCYVPQTLQEAAFEGKIEFPEENGFTYYLSAPEDFSKENALLNGQTLTVVGVRENSALVTTVVFTPMPVITLETADGLAPTELDGAGAMRVFSAEYGKIWLDETPIEINVRGNTSTRFPKKGYRVKVVDDWGEKQNLSIAGLRSDDDWILNPMYSDTSKIREGLAYSIWNDMNSSGGTAKGSGFAYAEVLLNGEYWGLYLVQERIDRKQVDANKRSGVLYKVVVNDPPRVDVLLNCRDPEYCEGIELEFAGAGLDEPWNPAAGYVAWLTGENPVPLVSVAIDNFIDYGLFSMFTQAYDCHFKNQFLNCVYEGRGHVVYRIPWDLNNTFGDVWENDAVNTNFTEYRVLSPMIDPAFEKILNEADKKTVARVQERWTELRNGPIQQEPLYVRAQSMHRNIFAAIERDSVRWPQAGLGEGNALNILDIRQFLEEMLPMMDEFVAQLEPNT